MRRSCCFRDRAPQGFTLVEMLVVIAIIAVLAGIIFPVLAAAKTRTKVNAARMEMRSLQMAMTSYKSTYGVMPGSKTVYASTSANRDCRDFTYGTTYPNGSLLKPGYPVVVSYGRGWNYQTCNAELIALLKGPSTAAINTAITPPLRDLSVAGNPQQTDFFQARISSSANLPGLGPDGVLRDPWGNPYIISLDLNYDGECIDGLYGLLRKRNGLPAEIRAETLIWSFGPDGQANADPAVGIKGGQNKDNIVSWE